MTPGYKTSEFWLRILGKAIGVAMALIGMAAPSPTTQAIMTVLGGVLAIMAQYGYGDQRTQLKIADIAARKDLASAAIADPPVPPPAS